MNEEHPFWSRVHALLDEGRDPLADPAVHAHLVEHPEDYAPLEELVELLAALATISADELDPRPWAHVAPLLALAGLAAGLLLVLRPGEAAPDLDPAVYASLRSTIFDYHVELVVEDGVSRTHRTLTPHGETLRVDRIGAREGVLAHTVALAPEATR